MKNVNLIFTGFLLAVGIVGSGYVTSAFAALAAFVIAPPNFPNEKTAGVVTYVSGGVGFDEADAMKRAEANYPLTMKFVAHRNQRDELLTNVAVTIKDNNERIMLQTMSDGPYLYARIPDGTYVITAVIKGSPKLHIVNVAAQKTEHVVFEW
jgi:hypothetical protein